MQTEVLFLHAGAQPLPLPTEPVPATPSATAPGLFRRLAKMPTDAFVALQPVLDDALYACGALAGHEFEAALLIQRAEQRLMDRGVQK